MKKNQTLRALPLTLSLTAVAAMLHPAAARADDPNAPNTVRAGLYEIFYHVQSSDLQGAYTPSGYRLDVKNTQTAYFAYIRRLTSFLDLEIAGGIPPNTKTVGKGPATVGSVPYNGQEIATAKWAAPSALLEYKFFSESASLRPYIGVGVTYVSFYNRQVTQAGQEATGGPTRLSLTSSIGLKYQPSGARWSVVASFSNSRVESDIKTDTAGAIRTAHINFRPQALVIAAGYSF
jgi:outer membrane protein